MPKKIRIGVDTRDLRLAKTGKKTALEELCREFRRYPDKDFEFSFFESRVAGYAGTNKWLLMLEHIRFQWWKQVVLPIKAIRNRCDIVFSADYFVPLIQIGFKTVQIYHDAFFYEYPSHYNGYWRFVFKNLAVPAARRSSFVVVPTEYAKERIHHYTRIPKEKLVTVYEGPKTLVVGQHTQGLPGKLRQLENTKYLLHVGVMEKRKNLPALIASFKKLIDEGYSEYKLVLVGESSKKIFSDDYKNVKKAISDNGLEDQVILTGYLPDDELAQVYQHAFIYVFPSVNEGFGIPVLEAFRFGLPVLVANNSCLPEVGGDAVVGFDPYSVEDMSGKIKKLIDDPVLRNGLVQKGHERLNQFSWQKATAQIIDLFKKALHEN